MIWHGLYSGKMQRRQLVQNEKGTACPNAKVTVSRSQLSFLLGLSGRSQLFASDLTKETGEVLDARS